MYDLKTSPSGATFFFLIKVHTARFTKSRFDHFAFSRKWRLFEPRPRPVRSPIAIQRHEINPAAGTRAAITRQVFKRAGQNRGAKLFDDFRVSALNEPMIVREMTFSFEGFRSAHTQKADASSLARAAYNLSNRKTNWTSCRQIRFSPLSVVSRAFVCAFLMLRMPHTACRVRIASHRVGSHRVMRLAPVTERKNSTTGEAGIGGGGGGQKETK